MRSVKHQRIFSVVLGFGLLIMGSFFVLPLMVAAYMLGLMLIGFGVDSRMSNEAMEPVAAAPARPRPVATMSAAPKKAKPKARKKPARRKK